MQKRVVAGSEQWSASHVFADVSIYGYWFEARIAGKHFVLQNNADAVHWTREKGTGGAGAVADKPTALSSIRRFRQTVYSPQFKVPDWAPDVVYYYIFPDRFRNGDKRNDPKPGIDKYQNHSVELHKNWLDKPWRPGTGDGSDSVYNNDFFGGDLAGIIEKLDYIKALGANTIYMTPIFKAASNHKYDTADYKTIDPAFGRNEDFSRLTREAAKRGIRVIPDTSLNHVGSDSIYFDRYGNHRSKGAFEGSRIRPESPYANWFSFNDKATSADDQFKGWVGVKDLPEIDKSSPAFRQFAYRAPDSVMKMWLDRGASGWRMDVAPWVPDDFWREWRSAIKQHKPDALTVAETWFDSSKYFLGDMFDSTMNYIFRNAVQDYAAGGKATALVAQLEHLREAYPPQAHSALMNLLSSHDQARALHVLGWHDDKDSAATVALAKKRLMLAVFLQMTYPGSPTIYYGDEVGVSGGDDPYNRATYPWADLGGKPDLALLAQFKQLIAMRHAHPVLRRGSLQAPLYVDDHVVVLLRKLGTTWAVTASNNAVEPRRVTVPLPTSAPVAWRDALGGQAAQSVSGQLVMELPPLSGQVLIAR
jgi:cyclomaltodextrinase / maltogenic alpha-amylase / neopullulanase